MTGDVKFGGNDGTCSRFLSVYTTLSSGLVGVGDEAYVRKVASKMKVSISSDLVKKQVESRPGVIVTGLPSVLL